MRSWPKPRQAVCAVPPRPARSRRSLPKCSRWWLNDASAVGSGPAIWTSSSSFSRSPRWLAESIRPRRPKKGSLATSSSAARPIACSRSSPRWAHSSRQSRTALGLADPHELVLVEDLAPRRVVGGLVAKHPRTAGIDEHATGRQRAAGGDRRVDRVAGRRHQGQLGHLLMLAPVLVGRGAFGLIARLVLVPVKRVQAAGEVRERRQVSAGLELAARQHRRESAVAPAPRARASALSR